MKTVFLTPSRRAFGELVGAPEAVAEPTYDRAKAVEAARELRQLGATVPARRKPSKQNGALKAIRELRDADGSEIR